MASLTTRNITKTSADLSSVSIDSPESLTLIPSIHLIQELSVGLGKKLENLKKILDLNEIKWLGVSTTDPTSGYITINGIRYDNNDIDNGNYVTYTAPDTSAELKYIYGHGIWENIGDIVNLPDNFVMNKHVNPRANINLDKIAGLDINDLSNAEYVLSDVANLRTTLLAMIRDYKRFDINTVFSEISGNISNTVNLQIGENALNLTFLFNTEISRVSGNVYNTVTMSVDHLVGDLSTNINSIIKDISGDIITNNAVVANVLSQIATVNTNLCDFYDNIQGNISTVNKIVEDIKSTYADVNNLICTQICAVSGEIISYNNIESNVTAIVANISNEIGTIIENSTIDKLDMINNICSIVDAGVAEVHNTITNEINHSLVELLTMINTICSNVDAASAYVTNTIGTTFNDCSIGSIMSYDDTFYAGLNSYSMRYCGEFSDISAASKKLAESKTTIKTITLPHYDDETNSIIAQEQQLSITVNLIERGSVIAVGKENGPYEYYMCTSVPAIRTLNDAWKQVTWTPLVDDRIFIKKSNIIVVKELPQDNELLDGMFYVVVDPE